MHTKLAALSAATLLALTACGASHDAKPDTTDGADLAELQAAAHAAPACSEVWKVGATLPADYPDSEGCTNANGGVQFVAYFDCADGSQLVYQDPNLWAFAGQEIHEGDVSTLDGEYGKAYDTCQRGGAQ